MVAATVGPVEPQAPPAEIDEVKAKLRQMELEVRAEDMQCSVDHVQSAAGCFPENSWAQSCQLWLQLSRRFASARACCQPSTAVASSMSFAAAETCCWLKTQLLLE